MSIELEFLPLESAELPVSKIFDLGKQYRFVFKKNTQKSRISVELYDLDDSLLYTTRLIYGNYLLHATIDGVEFSGPIVPFNIDELFTDNEIDDTTVEPDNLSRVKNYVLI